MSEIKIDPRGKVAFVTGANRGIGRSIVIALLNSGASKVYAGARNPGTLSALKNEYGDRLIPVELDVTNKATIENAAALANDVNILVNNAGVLAMGGIFDEDAKDTFENHFNVNVWGVVDVTKAFIETIRAGGAGAIINLSSMAGLANMPMISTYSVSKATVHSITQGMRGELAKENVGVFGVYPGPIDTDMAAGFPMDKDSPDHVANEIVKALSNGVGDIFPDTMSTQMGAVYTGAPKELEKQFGSYVAEPS